jgi:GST-like protein
VPFQRQGQRLSDYPHVAGWFGSMGARDAIERAYGIGRAVNKKPTVTEASKRVVFGQR